MIPTTPLVVRFGRIGDMVLQTPLFQLLARRYGRPCRLLTSGSWSTSLFAAHPDVGEILELQARHRAFFWSPERWRLLRRLRQHDGPIYVSEDAPKQVERTRQLLRLAGIASDRCVFITDSAVEDEHWVERLVRFGNKTPDAFRSTHLVGNPAGDFKVPQLFVAAQDREECRAWLDRCGIAGPLVLIQPLNKRSIRWGRVRRNDPKSWPTARWSELVDGIRESLTDASILLCGSKAESRALRQMAIAIGGQVHVAAEDLPLSRLMALMTLAHSCVSVDTGPAHIAAAVGCPLVVLYGAERLEQWSRRSVAGRPIVELGGMSPRSSATDVRVGAVLNAWRTI